MKSKAGVADADQPFGGLDVICTCDFHQFPPVAGESLYSRRNPKDSTTLLGGELFKQFDTVVILDKQNRVTDEGWTELLSRLRVGEFTDEDISEIQKLVLSNPESEPVDFSSSPWKDAILITPRNAVRNRWNAAALDRHCKETGYIKYVVDAKDTTTKGAALSMEERLKVAGMPSARTGKLQDSLDIAVGMKAMVVLNLATEADVANGTRGTVTNILLDPREPPASPIDGIVMLTYPPAMVIFKPDVECPLDFSGIALSLVPPGHVPIVPASKSFMVSVNSRVKINVKRRQLALTAAYAFGL